MKMKSFFFFLLLFFLINTGYSQKVILTGFVKDSLNLPLSLANVMAINTDKNTIEEYAITDEKGRYRLVLNKSQKYKLKISYMGFIEAEIKIYTTENDTKITKNITLYEDESQLDTVEIVYEMPVTIKGDTIIYKTEAFTNGKEKKLKDVLNKLPGIEVDKDGSVKVQGKKVTKLMVEGKDFFDGDPKLATKNIPANAIDKVEVLRNYNKIQQTKGLGNDENIALNIKLKDGKKNIFFGDLEAGGGIEKKHLAHSNIFYYSPKTTLNFIGGTNNIGRNTFTMNDYFRFSGGLKNLMRKGGASLRLSSDELGISFLKDDRAKDFNSKIAAFNINHSFSKKFQFQSFVIASTNTTGLETISSKKQLTENLEQVENTQSVTNQNNKSGLVKMNASYEPNSRLYINYDAILKKGNIEENKRIFSKFNEINNTIESNRSKNPFTIEQSLEAYYTLHEKHIFSFETQYLNKKQTPNYDLNTTEQTFELLLPLIDEGTDFNVLQTKETNTQKTESALNYYAILNKKSHLNFTIGNIFLKQKFNSSIIQTLNDTSQINLIADTYTNESTYQFTDYFAGIHYKIKAGKFIVNSGVNLHFFYLKDNQLNQTKSKYLTKLLPDFFAKYNIKKSESLTFKYNLQTDFIGIDKRAAGTTISSYNHLFKGNKDLTPTLYHQYSLQYLNYNMFSFSTVFAMLNYAKKFDDIKSDITYFGNNITENPINIAQANDYLTANATYEKRYKNYKINLDSQIGFTSTYTQTNGDLALSKSINQEYKLSVASNYSEVPNFEIGYSKGINNYSSVATNNTFTTDKPFINIEASFLKNFILIADYNYTYYQNKSRTSLSKYSFLNANLYYQKEDSKFEFKLSGNNLLKTKTLQQDYFSDYIISTSQYYVQPRFFMLSLKYDI